jgi:hypothetical protein
MYPKRPKIGLFFENFSLVCLLCTPSNWPKTAVYATGKGEDSWDVGRNLRTYVLHQNTLLINNRSHGRLAAVSGAAKHDRTMTWW